MTFQKSCIDGESYQENMKYLVTSLQLESWTLFQVSHSVDEECFSSCFLLNILDYQQDCASFCMFKGLLAFSFNFGTVGGQPTTDFILLVFLSTSFSVCGVRDDWGLCLASWDRGDIKMKKIQY